MLDSRNVDAQIAAGKRGHGCRHLRNRSGNEPADNKKGSRETASKTRQRDGKHNQCRTLIGRSRRIRCSIHLLTHLLGLVAQHLA